MREGSRRTVVSVLCGEGGAQDFKDPAVQIKRRVGAAMIAAADWETKTLLVLKF